MSHVLASVIRASARSPLEARLSGALYEESAVATMAAGGE
jgi:hypothetical protein